MKKVFKIVLLAATMTAGFSTAANANELDDLLKEIKSDRISVAKLDKKREAEFKSARADKQALLNKAKKAKAVDPSIAGLANKYIKNYKGYIPTTKDLFAEAIDSGTKHKIGCWINETVIVP